MALTGTFQPISRAHSFRLLSLLSPKNSPTVEPPVCGTGHDRHRGTRVGINISQLDPELSRGRAGKHFHQLHRPLYLCSKLFICVWVSFLLWWRPNHKQTLNALVFSPLSFPISFRRTALYNKTVKQKAVFIVHKRFALWRENCSKFMRHTLDIVLQRRSTKLCNNETENAVRSLSFLFFFC